MLKEGYAKRSAAYVAKVEELKLQDLRFAAYRFVVGFSALAALVASLYFASLPLGLIGLGAFVGFGFLVARHQQIRSDRTLNYTLATINQEELGYLDGRFEVFPDGHEYVDGTHFYADDLDLFGKSSLFQRINRSFNQRGRDVLAQWMNALDYDRFHARQAIVKDLRDRVELRQHFFSTARNLGETGFDQEALSKWSVVEEELPWWSRPIVLWFLSLWFPLLAIGLFLTSGVSYLDQLIYPFLLNVLVFFNIFRQIRKQQDRMDDLHRRFQVYAELIKQLEGVDGASVELRAVLEPLLVEGVPASTVLARLARTLSRADSANNVFGAALINGFVFYHLHVFRQLLLWKRQFASQLDPWVAAVHRIEAYLSLANYAYNHPEFTFPHLEEDAQDLLETEELGHPFIVKEKRVSNSIDFEEMKIVVLTGSNMSGKSTFLRSIGLAMVMSSLGLPVCATRLRLSRWRLLSSMKPQDDVNQNTSYFQAEVNCLRQMMDVVEGGTHCFLLLDEILRGTNSEDKRNGTQGFLQRLQQYHVKGVLATHDVEIAEMARSNAAFKNYYFESGYNGSALTFDYQLREGVCASPNATQLLKLNKLID